MRRSGGEGLVELGSICLFVLVIAKDTQNFMLIDSCFKNDYNASLRPTRKVGKPVKGGTIVGQNKIYLILIPPNIHINYCI